MYSNIFRTVQKNVLYGKMNKVMLGSLGLNFMCRCSVILNWIKILVLEHSDSNLYISVLNESLGYLEENIFGHWKQDSSHKCYLGVCLQVVVTFWRAVLEGFCSAGFFFSGGL